MTRILVYAGLSVILLMSWLVGDARAQTITIYVLEWQGHPATIHDMDEGACETMKAGIKVRSDGPDDWQCVPHDVWREIV